MHNCTIGTDADSGEAIRLRRMHANEIERLIQQARRDAIYEVETFLEENQIALFQWDHRGDEKVIGEEVSVHIIRKLLEK